MHYYLLAPIWAISTFVIYKIVSTFITSRYHAREAKRLGCQPPHVRKSKLPLGIDFVKLALKADKEKLFPEHMMDIYREQGGASTWLYGILGNPTYFTVDPKNIQAILATQFNDFSLGETRRAIFWPLLGNGIFTSDGKSWEHARAMMRPQFAREQVSDLDLEELHVRNMFLALPTDTSGWTSHVDLQVLFFRLTLDSATEFLFGESVDSQLANLPEGIRPPTNEKTADWASFAASFDKGTGYLETRGRLQEYYWLINPAEFRATCDRVHKFADYYVQLALSNHLSDLKTKDLEEGSGRTKQKYIFLEALVAQTRDPIELRSQLLNILLAGRDTTAGLLGWLWFILVRHQNVFNQLRQTVLDDFGTYEKPHDITFARLKSCTFLQHCLNETLRLYTVVPLNSRRAVRDTTLPRGGGPDGQGKLYVRKNQEVNYAVHVMHRRKDIWGPDADEFKPERWVGRKPGWEYLPFNGGPRICIGQQFALTEASYVTVRMLQKFDKIENLETDPVIRHRLTLTSAAEAVNVRLHAATA